MRAILPSIATLAILCAACSSDTPSSPSGDMNREAVASVVGGVTYPLVDITPSIFALKLNDSAVVQANLTDGSGSWKGKYIHWKSSDTTVLQVTVTGVGDPSGSIAHLKGLKRGTATITATTQSKTVGQKSVLVVGTVTAGDTVVAKVVVTPNWRNIASSSTFQLVGTAYNAAGTAITGAKLTWKSTGPAMSVTQTGLVKGLSKGTANAEAYAPNGKMGWSTIIDTGGVAVVAPPPSGKGVAAVWSDRLVGSVGVSAHFSYWDQLPYGNNVNQTLASIKAAGLRYVRDELKVDPNAGWNNRYWGVLKSLTQQGQKVLLITQPGAGVSYPYANQSNLDTAVSRIGASNILAFEGPNEVDNNNYAWGGLSVYGSRARTYQSAMYQRAKQIAPSVPVIGLTTTSFAGATAVGDLSSYMDAATMHPYPWAGVPTALLSQTEGNLAPLNGAHKGWWVTETGYHTAPNATINLFQPGVSEAAQGKYIDRIYLDYFNAGISHTVVYAIADGQNNHNDAEMNFGLLHNDGSPKPAYNALKNMLTLLSDPGATFTPSSLSYSLTGMTSTVRQALFQKRDGRFYLVLWNDVLAYTQTGKSDVINATVPVLVSLGVQPRVISRYQPYLSASPTSIAASRSIAVWVPDHPVILEITP